MCSHNQVHAWLLFFHLSLANKWGFGRLQPAIGWKRFNKGVSDMRENCIASSVFIFIEWLTWHKYIYIFIFQLFYSVYSMTTKVQFEYVLNPLYASIAWTKIVLTFSFKRKKNPKIQIHFDWQARTNFRHLSLYHKLNWTNWLEKKRTRFSCSTSEDNCLDILNTTRTNLFIECMWIQSLKIWWVYL